MASPEGYFDDRTDYDPPPRNSPRLVADVARLAGVRTPADVRDSPGPPLTPRRRKIRRRHVIILLARLYGLPLNVIADAFDLTPARISMICREMGYGDL